MGPLTKALASHLPPVLKCNQYPDKKQQFLDCIFTRRIGSDICPEAMRDVLPSEPQLSRRLLTWQVEGRLICTACLLIFSEEGVFREQTVTKT